MLDSSNTWGVKASIQNRCRRAASVHNCSQTGPHGLLFAVLTSGMLLAGAGIAPVREVMLLAGDESLNYVLAKL